LLPAKLYPPEAGYEHEDERSCPSIEVHKISAHKLLDTPILLFYVQQEPYFQVSKANPRADRCSGVDPSIGKGKRRARQASESSSSSNDPIESLVDPEILANGEGQLIGPAAARELDKKNKKDNEVKKDDNGSLNIRIHLDLHAKVKLDLEADLYGDIVIGLF
jgi:hypothetical protein